MKLNDRTGPEADFGQLKVTCGALSGAAVRGSHTVSFPDVWEGLKNSHLNVDIPLAYPQLGLCCWLDNTSSSHGHPVTCSS